MSSLAAQRRLPWLRQCAGVSVLLRARKARDDPRKEPVCTGGKVHTHAPVAGVPHLSGSFAVLFGDEQQRNVPGVPALQG